MATYEICGTCSIQRHENQTIIRIAPTTGYISRDKKTAILYPYLPVATNINATKSDETTVAETDGIALLIPIRTKMGCSYIEIPLHTDDNILNHTLLKASDSMKLVQIHVEKYDGKFQITGCLFPAP